MPRYTKEQREAGHETLREIRRESRRERDLEELQEDIDDVPNDYREAFDDLMKDEDHFEDN